LFADKFNNHRNQFGFVKEGGCNKALFVFNSVVRYFSSKGSNVFCCSLDATKAFDRLNHFYILSCLIERGFPLCIVNVFASWYRNLNAYVRCDNNVVSTCFNVLSGTPQGSLLGGKFFNFIIDKLLTQLDDAQIGCHINGLFAGAIAYADDIMLLSASVVQMREMLEICYKFGISCDLKFNCAKSFWGLVGKLYRSDVLEFKIGGNLVPKCDKITYLGIDFTFGSSLGIDCSKRTQKFMAAVSSILLHKVIGYESLFSTLLISKCLPILSYGLDCLMLDSKSLNSVSKAWNTAFRWLFGLSKFVSTRLLFLQCKTMSLKFLLDCRLMCFFQSIIQSSNVLVKCLSLCSLCEGNCFKACFERYELFYISNKDAVKCRVESMFNEYCNAKL
jgi:hypothetical protein